MATTYLRKVGGSFMMAIPRPLLEQLHMGEGSPAAIFLEGDHLIIQPQQKPRYTLEELLSQCDATAPVTPEDGEWLEAPAVGNEIL